MGEVMLILENGPSLTEKEKLEIINLGWLFAHVSESCQSKALKRILPLFRQKGVDAPTYMSVVREIAKYLQSAFEKQLHERRDARWSAANTSARRSPALT